MEADYSSALPATGMTTKTRTRAATIATTTRQQQFAPRDIIVPPPPIPGSASPISPSTTAVRDARFRRSPPKPNRKDGERPKTAGRGAAAAIGLARTKLWASSSAAQLKPLLPLTERKSQEDNLANRRAKTQGYDDEKEKWDITPDGGSAGREGRQFAVANVGNNGRIYLRPTVRPANQRYPQPAFVFPMTPPSTAGLEPMSPERRREADETVQNSHNRSWASPMAPSTPSLTREQSGEKHVQIRPRHRRAMSDSTLQETSIARESEPGGFKIVITQPGEEQRPRTVEDVDMTRTPLLEVSIPSWRIGTPRFSVRGTPFIRGSSYAPTEDIRSSRISFFNHTPLDTTSSASKVHNPGIFWAPAESSSPRPGPVPPPHTQSRSTYLSTHLVIEPAMFDSLTFKPACDDRSIVRYSTTGVVTAATPPRLVAEITSPSFLDYELLSDFFLTYRSFLEPSDLLRLLFARLKWALGRDDEAGMVVRVRTFVALRHWILNYFTDDFVIDYDIRSMFCNLLNDFVDEIARDTRVTKVPLKILAELKKCWRRVCAQYWDGAEFDATLGLHAPISPGGIAGHRDPSLDPSFWQEVDAGPPQLDGVITPISPRGHASFYADVSRAGHIDSIVVGGDRPATPENLMYGEEYERNQSASPTSITSLDVVSCSLPTKSMRFAHPGSSSGYPLAAHPADMSSVYNHSADPIATTPRALVGKRIRGHHSHKRNASLSDSLRDHATITEKVLYKNAEFLLTLPYAGSLVRGNLFPPSQALVEVLPSGSGAGARQTTLFQTPPVELPKERVAASAMSGQGMRKLLGSVRRALSTKGQTISQTQTYINISPIGPRGATTNRLPGTAIVPQARPRQNGVRPPVRIDLLGAKIAEDFKKAVREDAAAEAENQSYLSPPAAGSRVPGDLLDHSAAHMDTTFDFGTANVETRPTSDMGITTGSKSIVIVDETSLHDNYPMLNGEQNATSLHDNYPMMTGALPAVNSSVEAFAETFMPNGADPTPPTTPPGRPNMGTPRRSSYILGKHHLRHSVSADPLPPFIPDMDTLGSADRPSNDYVRLSFEFLHQSRNRPSLSGVQGHRRQASSRSFVSGRSLGYRRYASFTSGILPQPTIRSFDATTYSEGSVADADDSSQVLVPQPLRVLRRRPGGDLRAVNNVGDLDPSTLRRSRSVGSLTTYTDSLRSSYIRSPVLDSSGYVDVVTSDYSPGRADTFSLGAITKQQPQPKPQPPRQLSLFSTHSSKPIMRPSFEAEAQKLAQIPDDIYDDGGVESALLKLEGKFEETKKKIGAKLSMDLRQPPQIDISLEREDQEETETTRDEKEDHRHVHLGDELHASLSTMPTTISVQGGLLDVAGRQNRNADVQSFLSDDSRASYASVPLLNGGFTDDGGSKRTVTREWTDRSVLQGPDEGATPLDGRSLEGSQHPSYDFVERTNSLDRIQRGDTQPSAEPPRTSAEQSFLDIESDHDSDLSSELSMEMVDYQDREAGTVSPSAIGVAVTTLPIHPLASNSPAYPASQKPSTNPPSPPITLIQALNLTPEGVVSVPILDDHQVWEKPLPPTPDTTPTTVAAPPYNQYPLPSPPDPTGTKEALRNAPSLEIPDPIPEGIDQSHNNKLSVHLPFILAFESDVLAQQFTLIEKDALNEIDWKELIDMRWKNAEQNGINARSWVSFLRDTDARGVEVVIARFNIMVKWAISEIVLTQEIEERARCIIKFIHVAAHCRRYRNFATMSQLTIALTSNEIGRLTKTWAMVPPSDQRTLQELETLMSPTRNFYNLRAEMEGGGPLGPAASEMGCIPFVGIYTHDLLFNAQKPSEIASSPTTAPLVNFERCRTAAGVVKTLLRLLEASTLYDFQPVEGITERCLWMGALEDEEIRRLGEKLE
ncbi:guanine nucleotide exchange factor LTE1 [Podospora australis]|uniref:Guanine nucleotide exchange factor LTE1 n=1 Tax=Podospora australis TaxID=1536484 RepID=A0AAN7AC23_9PEZI|nr:guanine nucleotide exchange factor LTE1 [Podospora australis]